MSGKKVVKCSNIQATMKNGDIEGDWVTIGVVVQKTASKQSANGKNFSGKHFLFCECNIVLL